ncbi:hypothetical protein AB0K18_13155 [Nonomuraea sp. NPDC049421]|uniref:hypothetical protein n=1 Tax=Nonomuraea sp. NPDC049421 TaxID=3155275 RepID=UPI00342BDE68
MSGDRSAAFQILVAVTLAQAEYRLGRWEEAVAHAELGASTADDFGQAWPASLAHAMAALMPAARGEWERARCRTWSSATWSWPRAGVRCCARRTPPGWG